MTAYDAAPVSGAAVLIVAAVEAEREAVRRGLAAAGDASAADVIAAGVGPAAAAAATALALAAGRYRLVVSAGIGGGFPGIAPIGSLVLADAIVAADLGAETPDGFLGVDELGFGSARAAVSAEWNSRLLEAWRRAGLAVTAGPVLTVSCATGTAHTAERRAQLVPGAAAEGMEGYGVACAAERLGVPAVELRSISNLIGPRDRASWRIGDALLALERAAAAMAGELPPRD